ncbi:MAG TPA: primase C-terminal domain-containing protein, partial [Bacteroides reticulotermitis]|nr:primase C-terminal domain-containing protein [Bacteroides reticulotermitis]
MEKETHQFVSSYIFLNPPTSGKRHSNLFKLACEACRRQYSEKVILRELCTYLEGTDFLLAELKAVLSSGYKQVNTQNSPSLNQHPSASQMDKWTNGHYVHIEKETDAEESYWQGEELRKSTH